LSSLPTGSVRSSILPAADLSHSSASKRPRPISPPPAFTDDTRNIEAGRPHLHPSKRPRND
jgi:hypothetical protein